jgi:hypothetical protein
MMVLKFLTAAQVTAGGVQLGSPLADIGRPAKLTAEDLTVFDQRDNTPAEPLSFQ